MSARVSSAPHQFPSGLGRARLPQGVNVSTHRDLPPHSRLRLLCEPAPRVHHQHPIGRQAVHVTIWVLPLGGFLLEGLGRSKSNVTHRQTHTHTGKHTHTCKQCPCVTVLLVEIVFANLVCSVWLVAFQANFHFGSAAVFQLAKQGSNHRVCKC